jgi:hypothetical protein
MATTDEYGFVAGRSRKNAQALLDIAEKQGIDSTLIRTTMDGYYVPVSVAKEYEEGLGAPEFEAGEEEAPAEGTLTPDETWKVAELKVFAQDNKVDLGDATKKADILAAIRTATA